MTYFQSEFILDKPRVKFCALFVITVCLNHQGYGVIR